MSVCYFWLRPSRDFITCTANVKAIEQQIRCIRHVHISIRKQRGRQSEAVVRFAFKQILADAFAFDAQSLRGKKKEATTAHSSIFMVIIAGLADGPAAI